MRPKEASCLPNLGVDRNIHVSSTLIMTPEDFEDFIVSKPNFGSPVYLKFLKSFSPLDRPMPGCVFTHGDIRPANIKIKQNEDGSWKALGIID